MRGKERKYWRLFDFSQFLDFTIPLEGEGYPATQQHQTPYSTVFVHIFFGPSQLFVHTP